MVLDSSVMNVAISQIVDDLDMGLDAFETGKRLLPLSVAMLVFTPSRPRRPIRRIAALARRRRAHGAALALAHAATSDRVAHGPVTVLVRPGLTAQPLTRGLTSARGDAP
jgi:hypothetical protein